MGKTVDDHDLEEATNILRDVRVELAGREETQSERKKAAETLLSAVKVAAKNAGFDVDDRGKVLAIRLGDRGSVSLVFDDDRQWVSVDGPPPRDVPLPIKYTGASGYVGTDLEAGRNPIPGERSEKRKKAVIAVIEVIAAELRVQAGARGLDR